MRVIRPLVAEDIIRTQITEISSMNPSVSKQVESWLISDRDQFGLQDEANHLNTPQAGEPETLHEKGPSSPWT